MPISGSEKRGATMVTSCFSAKPEHVPIKKRKFLWRSPSPPAQPQPQPQPQPPRMYSEPTMETTSLAKGPDALGKLSPLESTSFDVKMSKNIYNSNSTDDTTNKIFGENQDFSGISILAAAACISSLGAEGQYNSLVETSAQGQALEVSAITEAPSSSRGLLTEDLVNSSEMSTGGSSSCVSTEPVRELASISTTVNSSPKVTSNDVSFKADSLILSGDISLKVDPLILSGDVSCSKEEVVGIQKSCLQDVRLHWDLNVVMDAWEQPFESPKGQNDVPPVTSEYSGKHDKLDNTQCLEENNVNHAVCFGHNVTQPMGIDEKDAEDSKSICYNATIQSTSELAIYPATLPDASGTMHENDGDVSVQSLTSNGDGFLTRGTTLGSLNLRSSRSYSALDNLRSACASTNDMQPSLAVSSGPDSPGQSIQNLAVLGNIKTCFGLQYNANAIAENDELKTSHVEVPKYTSPRCELPVGLDTELRCVDNHLFKGTCDSISHDTSEANFSRNTVNRNLYSISSAGNDALVEVPEDFGSQYEDGEVRDPNEQPYKAEPTDLLEDMNVCTPIDYCSSELGYVEDSKKCEVISSSVGYVNRDITEESILPIGGIQQDNQVMLSASSDMDIALSDDNGGKETSVSQSETNVESEPLIRGPQSRIEQMNKGEFRYDESTSTRPFERPRYSFHNQGRGQRDSWNSFRGNCRGGFRRHYSPTMHGSAKTDDPRNRPGADEDEYNGLHSCYRPDRGFSPERSSTFSRGRGRGRERGRGRYNGTSRDEGFQSSNSWSYRQSFSPFGGPGGRGPSNSHYSRGKSPSQSRSRSPVLWNSPSGRPRGGRGRATFIRQRSRSPNFGSDLRMQRLRPDFRHDESLGFRNIPRIHGSPPHDRWNSAGKEAMGNFREFGYKQRPSSAERSPMRIRLRGDRVGALDSPRDLKPERYEENFQGRRKYNRDNDDSFYVTKDIRGREASDFEGRGMGMNIRGSNLPRRFRGEQHSSMFNRDNDNVMDPSRNMKSDEHYQSSSRGRFSDGNGFNRVRRYDNFEDRRRHYDPPNVMKRNDTEGSEKRLNQNIDENFQDNSDISSRGIRSFNGRVGALSTSLREDKASPVCGQENKVEDNPH